MKGKRDRGWSLERNEWVYGAYVELPACSDKPESGDVVTGIVSEDSFWNVENLNMIEVVRESVGRGTGEFVDDQELFEGDIVRLEDASNGSAITGIICYGEYHEYCKAHIGFHIDWRGARHPFDGNSFIAWIDKCRKPDALWGWRWKMTIVGNMYEKEIKKD